MTSVDGEAGWSIAYYVGCIEVAFFKYLTQSMAEVGCCLSDVLGILKFFDIASLKDLSIDEE